MFWWPLLDLSTSGRRSIDPQATKFEQVCSDGHQMSVAGQVVPRSHVWEEGKRVGTQVPYLEGGWRGGVGLMSG